MNNLRQFLKAIVVCSIVFSSLELCARDENKSCLSNHCQKPEKKKRTCAPTPISHATTITKSGSYCLTRNIEGTIVIAADDVRLDLNGHEVDAEGNPYAISIIDVKDVAVFNGSVSGSTVAGIFVDPSISIKLFDLFMHDHVLNAIQMANTTDVDVHNVDFAGDNGERAILFDTCNNISVSNCNMSGFLSTLGAVLELNTCNSAIVSDVNVFNCTKTSEAGAYFFTAPTAFVFVGGQGIPAVETITGCTGVDLVRVKVNNNIINNTNPATDPDNVGVNWRTAEAILCIFSSDCTLTDCQTSNNNDIAGSSATMDTEDYVICCLFCDSFLINNHQSNDNSCAEPIAYFAPIAAFDSNSMVLDGCQANNNIVGELIVAPFISEMTGIWIEVYFDFASIHDTVVRNCQANFNQVIAGGAGRTGFFQTGFLFGIITGGPNCIMDNCQANHNSMGDANPHTSVIGILSESASNSSFSNSSANYNTGGFQAMGFDLHITNIATTGAGQKLLNCTASSNGNFGISIGYFEDLDQTNADIAIIDCVCNQNGGGTGTVAGIYTVPVVGGTRNLLIKGCQIFDTVSSSTFTTDTVSGIDIRNTSNALVQNCQIYNTSGPNGAFAYGISILDSVQCVIEGCEANQSNSNNNYGQGFVLRGSTTNSKVQDCSAIGNTNDGFADFFEQNSWFGNTAEANNPNYSGVKNTPVVYSRGTGMFSSTPNRWSNIDIQP